MKTFKVLLVIALGAFAVGGIARADEAKAGKKDAKCCAAAAEKGQACTHECCATAAKDGKACEKCGGTNPKAG